MNARHTPGPWSIWNFSDDPRHVAVGPDAGGLAVADVVACNAHGCYTAETESRGQANARLIAAAPDLLSVLRWWMDQIQNDGCDDMGKLLDDMTDKTRAAIAKAEGKQL